MTAIAVSVLLMSFAVNVPAAFLNAPVPPATLALVILPVLRLMVNVPYSMPPSVSIVTFAALDVAEVATP